MPSNMYAGAKTWNPFVGCLHGCIYCRPSFQAQLRRWAKRNCELCYRYTPHAHLERLGRIPSSEIVFVCGNGDIAFAGFETLKLIAGRLREHSRRCPGRTYFFQSKDWDRAGRIAPLIENIKGAIVLETLETNRDGGYSAISSAPPPTARHRSFLTLSFPRKAVTVEPLLDFDVGEFFEMIASVEPEFVWIGYNSKPTAVQLPEPSPKKVTELISLLKSSRIEVRAKNLRGLAV
jgi:hypothetical protein